MDTTPSVTRPEDLKRWAADLATEVEQLRRLVRETQAKLAAAEERYDLVNRLLELTKAPPPLEPETKPDATHVLPRANHSSNASSDVELEDAVEDMLAESGSPLHISMIKERLVAEGVRIPGRGDDANIIVRLRKFDSRFTRTARGTYGLASWGLPSVDTGRRASRSTKSSKK